MLKMENKKSSLAAKNDIGNTTDPNMPERSRLLRDHRILYSEKQIYYLEKEFERTQYPASDTRDALANKLDMSEINVQIWFQNRRYKFLQDERTMHFLWSTQGHVNFAARGTFTLEVPSPTAAALHHDQHYGGHIKEMYSSPTVTNIGDLKWQLEVRKEGNGNNYLVYANCNEKCTEHFWFCCAMFTLYATEEGGGGRRKKICSTDLAYVFYGTNSLLIGPTIRPRKGTISLSLDVDILRVLPKMFALDTNIEVKMANGTKIVAVNKQGLACVSNYFQNFFFASWREKGKEDFVIHEEDDPDFDIDSFKLMIYGALSLAWMVTDLVELLIFKENSRLVDILKLSVKYDMPPICQYCENQVIANETKYPVTFQLLELADQLNLTKLSDHCLAKIDDGTGKFWDKITESIEDYRLRLGKTTIEKLNKILEKYPMSRMGKLKKIKEASQVLPYGNYNYNADYYFWPYYHNQQNQSWYHALASSNTECFGTSSSSSSSSSNALIDYTAHNWKPKGCETNEYGKKRKLEPMRSWEHEDDHELFIGKPVTAEENVDGTTNL